MIDNKEVIAVITAAGSGKRMELSKTKQLLEIGKMTVIERSVKKVYNSKYVDRLVLVVREEEIEEIKNIMGEKYGAIDYKIGGKEREDSTWEGIKDLEEGKILLMHDGARPFVTTSFIDEMLEGFSDKAALISGVYCKDTIKKIDPAKGLVLETPDRSSLFMVQTPQLFRSEILIKAYKMSREKKLKFTDDSSLLEYLGIDVHYILGSYDNFKLTTREDLKLAGLLAEEEDFCV